MMILLYHYQWCPFTNVFLADMCIEHETFNRRKGHFNWPRIPVETRIFLACPYTLPGDAGNNGGDRPFAFRECRLETTVFNTTSIIWTKANMTACPDPPFSEKLKAIVEHAVSFIDDLDP